MARGSVVPAQIELELELELATSESFLTVLTRVEPAASVLRLGLPAALTIQLTSAAGLGFVQDDPVVCLFAAVLAQPLEGAAELARERRRGVCGARCV